MVMASLIIFGLCELVTQNFMSQKLPAGLDLLNANCI